jgi:hypothetical protein
MRLGKQRRVMRSLLPGAGMETPSRSQRLEQEINEEKSNPCQHAQIEQESTRRTEMKIKLLSQETHHE